MELLDEILKLYYDNQDTITADIEKTPRWVVFRSTPLSNYTDEKGRKWDILTMAIDEQVICRFRGVLGNIEKLNDAVREFRNQIDIHPVMLTNTFEATDEDMPLLTASFAVEFIQKYSKPIKKYSNIGLRSHIR